MITATQQRFTLHSEPVLHSERVQTYLAQDSERTTVILNMSTTRLTVYDLLRITYTYEGKALEEAARIRRDSVCSVGSADVAATRG